MATQVQFRRGTTSQNNAFTGAQGELTIDTDVYTIRIHDGTTAGGKQVPTLTATQTFTNKTMSTSSVWNGNAIGLGYGGTGAALTGVAGAVVYSTGSAMALSLAGTSGQVLTSGGTSGPTWVAASALSTGTATTATTATNIAGGSAGYLVYQEDTNTTAFIAPGDSGFVLRSTGASTAPSWVSSTVTLGTTAVQVGDAVTSFAGVRSITMGNGSHGGATVASVSGTGPWTATLTGISSTTGIQVGQNITATAGTGTLYGGTPTSVLVASIVSGTSITVTVTGGTIPTAGTITSLTTFGFLQVPTGTTAQRPWVPANGMIRYNSTQSTFEGYSSSAWSSLGGVKSVDGYTYIQAETSAGASNGDLDFYAEDSAGTAATQIGQWNRTNLKDYTGTLVGTQTTQAVFNTTATTVNAFGAATTLTLGNATSATATIRPGTIVGSNTTQNLWNTTATTVNAFGAATAINIGASNAVTTVNGKLTVAGAYANTHLTTYGSLFLDGTSTNNIVQASSNTRSAGIGLWSTGGTGRVYTSGGDFEILVGTTLRDQDTPTGGTTAVTINGTTGAVQLASDLAVNGGDITTSATTFNLLNATATTLNIGGAATTLSIGAGSGNTTVNNNLIVTGNMTVNGTTTTINATTISVDDKNIELGSVATPTDTTADGGGITLKGATDKTFNWVDATDAWTSSEHMNIASGKAYYIAGTSVLNATTLGSGVTGSSLTSVGTIGTGTWQATVVTGQYGGTGVANTGKTITLGGNLTTSGAYATTFTATATTSVTLPTTGTLATLAGAETLTNKTLTSPTLTTPALGTPASGDFSTGTFTWPTFNQSTTGSAATLTTGRTIAITGDLTYTSGSFNGSANVTGTGTLATVNSNTGSFGSATTIPIVTVNAKGLVTAVTTAAVQGGQYYGSAATKAISYNSNTIAENITISTGTNGLSAGPVTISDGYTITIADGAVWSIV